MAYTAAELDTSGNYDCPSCGQMNCELGIYFTWHYPGEFGQWGACDMCVHRMALEDELEAYKAALREVE